MRQLIKNGAMVLLIVVMGMSLLWSFASTLGRLGTLQETVDSQSETIEQLVSTLELQRYHSITQSWELDSENARPFLPSAMYVSNISLARNALENNQRRAAKIFSQSALANLGIGAGCDAHAVLIDFPPELVELIANEVAPLYSFERAEDYTEESLFVVLYNPPPAYCS